MDRELKIPGVLWNFSQPIADNMEEAVSGVKANWPSKIYGDDLSSRRKRRRNRASHAASRRRRRPRPLPRHRPAQPQFRRGPRTGRPPQINVADVQDAIETAVGGNAVSQVLQGEATLRPRLRYLAPYRDTTEAIENIRLLSPTGERVSSRSSPKSRSRTAPRKSIAKKIRVTSPSNTASAAATWAAPSKKPFNVNAKVKLPRGYHIDWAGEYESRTLAGTACCSSCPSRSSDLLILYTMFRSVNGPR